MTPDEPKVKRWVLQREMNGAFHHYVLASDFDALKLAHDALRSRLEAAQRAADALVTALDFYAEFGTHPKGNIAMRALDNYRAATSVEKEGGT